jgi:hypothetical protein
MEPPDFIDIAGPEPTTRLPEMRNLSIVLQLVREAIEDCAPPGSLQCGEYMTPEPWLEAEALVRGIYAIAYGKQRE